MVFLLKTLVHYTLHLIVPAGISWLLYGSARWQTAYKVMLLTMLVDLDHLFARPIFAPDRCSIGFHPLHSYPMIVIYILMCILPYQRLRWPWWLGAVGVGLTLHMFTDWQDYYLWRMM